MAALEPSTVWAFGEVMSTTPQERTREADATVTKVDGEGVAWVTVAGSDAETPVNGGSVSALGVGQTVRVRVEGGRLWVLGSSSSPSVGTSYVGAAIKPVDQKAEQALIESSRAKAAADAAERDANRAATAATNAEASADTAAQAATNAEGSASTAATAATNAQGSASTAATAATNAQASAGQAATNAQNAATSASQAASDAAAANTAANQAIADAQAAQTAADQAVGSANQAVESAGRAENSARAANTAANSALTQLSVVEDVSGTLSWIRDHGTYRATTDTTVQDGTVYFELEGGEYVPIAEPSGNPSAQGWYVLDVTDSQTDYIMAHLAVTSAGLWVLPSGIDAEKGAQRSPGYKALLSNAGMTVYDPLGTAVVTYGESVTFATDRDWHVGNAQAFIFYDESEGTLQIGGANVTIGGKTPEQLLSHALSYDFSVTAEDGVYSLRAHLWRGDDEVTDEVDQGRFVWLLRTESGELLWARGPSTTIPASEAGYHGTIVGAYDEGEIYIEQALTDHGGAVFVTDLGMVLAAYTLVEE